MSHIDLHIRKDNFSACPDFNAIYKAQKDGIYLAHVFQVKTIYLVIVCNGIVCFYPVTNDIIKSQEVKAVEVPSAQSGITINDVKDVIALLTSSTELLPTVQKQSKGK